MGYNSVPSNITENVENAVQRSSLTTLVNLQDIKYSLNLDRLNIPTAIYNTFIDESLIASYNQLNLKTQATDGEALASVAVDSYSAGSVIASNGNTYSTGDSWSQIASFNPDTQVYDVEMEVKRGRRRVTYNYADGTSNQVVQSDTYTDVYTVRSFGNPSKSKEVDSITVEHEKEYLNESWTVYTRNIEVYDIGTVTYKSQGTITTVQYDLSSKGFSQAPTEAIVVLDSPSSAGMSYEVTIRDNNGNAQTLTNLNEFVGISNITGTVVEADIVLKSDGATKTSLKSYTIGFR